MGTALAEQPRPADRASRPRARREPRRRLSRISLLVLAGGLLVTGLGVRFATDLQREDDVTFAVDSAAARLAVERRVAIYEETLVGLRGLYAASEYVSRAEFHDYVSTAGIATRFPGIQAVEFSRRVAADDVDAFETAVRADGSLNGTGYSGFEVHPRTETTEHFVVDYVEPLEGNEAALGFDLGSNAVRLAALEQARDSAEPVATGPIRLVQETGEQTGFLVLVPIYDNDMP